MLHQTFGWRSGLRVSAYALGTVNFGTRWGTGTAPDEARAIFDRFTTAGGTFIDTSDSYERAESEEILGDLLATDRDHFTVATKFGSPDGTHRGITVSGNSRKNMIRAVEASLRRLRTDRIDLYWAHFPDGLTPIDEILRGFDDLVSAGKILYAGLSNFPAWQVSHATAITDLRGWAPVTAIQAEYSLLERTADRELLPMASALGLGVGMWSPLGGGRLTGKYRTSDAGRLTDWRGALVHAENKVVLDLVLDIAAELGVSPVQVSMAWLLHRQAQSPTALIPLIGPRTVAHLDEYLAALRLTLPQEQIAQLDEASAVAPGVPFVENRRLPNGVRRPMVPVL
jgi:aryl-alcohol dehydrogenase-like predicted oxidoreductase